MARVEGEDDAKQSTAQHIIPVMPVVSDATDAAESDPNHEQALQEGNEK